ncbi:MAG: hypothetical protein ACN2B6_02910 [Rickettsiales bacterium]
MQDPKLKARGPKPDGFRGLVRKGLPLASGIVIGVAGTQVLGGNSIALETKDDQGQKLVIQPDAEELQVVKQELVAALTSYPEAERADLMMGQIGLIIGTWIIDQKPHEGEVLSATSGGEYNVDDFAAKIALTRIEAMSRAISELPADRRDEMLQKIDMLKGVLSDSDPRSAETINMLTQFRDGAIGASATDVKGMAMIGEQQSQERPFSTWIDPYAPKGKEIAAEAKISDHDVWAAIDVLNIIRNRVEDLSVRPAKGR